MSRVLFGIDEVVTTPGLVTGKIGLVTNDAARTARDAQLTSRAALQRARVRLVRLFSPEHGLGANAADGAAVADSVDSPTGLPIVSLYGEHVRPPRESLADLDALVFDVPDIGARFYTYLWTMSHALEACAEAGRPLVVLDRPNPLGGELSAAEGPVLDAKQFSSFVGRAAIPIRHSLTLGELARLLNTEWKLAADVRVIRCANWKRSQHWPDTGLPFIKPSPAIPNYESALLYPGLCLFEATNLSVGRGTDWPFQVIGAPWLDARGLAQSFNSRGLPGATAQTCEFVPRQKPFASERCTGVRIRVTNAKTFRPVATGLHLLSAVLPSHRDSFRWSGYPTVANPGGEGHFERLIGRADIREVLEQNPRDLSARVREWTAAPGWAERVKDFLLYT